MSFAPDPLLWGLSPMTLEPKDNPFSGSTQRSPSMCYQILILCPRSGTPTRLGLVTFYSGLLGLLSMAPPTGQDPSFNSSPQPLGKA